MARLDRFDHAFVAGDLPAHAVADHQIGLAAAQMALHTLPGVGLDEGMPAVRRHDARDRQVLMPAQGLGRASASAARRSDAGGCE